MPQTTSIVPVGGVMPSTPVVPIGGVVSSSSTPSPAPAAPQPTDKPSWLDQAIAIANVLPGMPHPDDLKRLAEQLPDWLPVLEGTGGGIIGGIAGAGAGGIGAIPGSIAGAAIGGASGEAHRQLANRAMGRSAPATSAQAAKDVLMQGGVQGASELVGAGLTPVLSRAGTVLVQSAVKPGLKTTARALARGVAPEDLPVVRTLIQEGVNVTPGGIAKLDRIISATNDEIATAVNAIPGTPIDPVAVAARVDPVAVSVGQDVAPDAALASVEKVKQQFLAKDANTALQQVGTTQTPTSILGPNGQPLTTSTPIMKRVPVPISAASAQAQKQGGYRALKETAYGQMQGPEIEARKAILRGLKEDIATEAAKHGVDLTAKNAREGAAIEAKEAIAKRLAAASNRDPIALAWLAHNPVHGLLYIAEKSPAVKSLIGRGLYNQAAKVAGVPEFIIRALVSSLVQSEGE